MVLGTRLITETAGIGVPIWMPSAGTGLHGDFHASISVRYYDKAGMGHIDKPPVLGHIE
jgi:hypothetical protein